MKHISVVIILILIPIYVLSVFVTFVFAPTTNYEIEEIKKQNTKITFVGDMMFDRYVRDKAEQNGYDAIFNNIKNVFHESDVLVGNLEGPITTFTPVSRPLDRSVNHYRFTFATSVAPALVSSGFNAIFLANNHIQNFGKDGYEQTKKILTENKIGFFGSPDDSYTPWRYATGTKHVVMYAFDTWHARDVETITQKITDEPNEYFVVVYAHWGDEYESEPNAGQIDIAHQFIDSGADIVIGSHSHVIQSKENYKGKWIYYSLGNFVFDQYFNDVVTCGAVITIEIKDDNTYTVNENFSELRRDGTTKVSTCMKEVPLKKE